MGGCREWGRGGGERGKGKGGYGLKEREAVGREKWGDRDGRVGEGWIEEKENISVNT